MMSSESGRPKLFALVALPGPVTGMTVATKVLVNYVGSHTRIRIFDLSRGFSNSQLLWKFRKLFNGFLGCFSLVLARIRGCKMILLIPNAGLGLLVTCLHVRLAKLFGMRVVLQHHVFSYIRTKKIAMKLVQGALDAGDLNVVLCESMGDALSSRYSGRARTFVLPNGYLIDDLEEEVGCHRVSNEIVLGHLSNLTVEKGLEDVVATAIQLRSMGVEVKLLLAGGLKGDREKDVFYQAQERLGTALEYIGPIYGEKKVDFFNRLNFFLFPSRYANEAQPVVILEALAAGVPVVATPIGCIPGLIQDEHGRLIGSSDFPSEAAVFVREVSKDDEKYRLMSLAARQFIKNISSRSLVQLEALVDHIKLN